jgi:predicted DNA-binding antitoxin AbrB/MazE fold protein
MGQRRSLAEVPLKQGERLELRLRCAQEDTAKNNVKSKNKSKSEPGARTKANHGQKRRSANEPQSRSHICQKPQMWDSRTLHP